MQIGSMTVQWYHVFVMWATWLVIAQVNCVCILFAPHLLKHRTCWLHVNPVVCVFAADSILAPAVKSAALNLVAGSV